MSFDKLLRVEYRSVQVFLTRRVCAVVCVEKKSEAEADLALTIVNAPTLSTPTPRAFHSHAHTQFPFIEADLSTVVSANVLTCWEPVPLPAPEDHVQVHFEPTEAGERKRFRPEIEIAPVQFVKQGKGAVPVSEQGIPLPKPEVIGQGPASLQGVLNTDAVFPEQPLHRLGGRPGA